MGWQDAPLATPAASQPAWQSAPLAHPAEAPKRDPEGSIPNLAALKAEAQKQQPEPSFGEKLRGGLEAGMELVKQAVAFVPTMAGAATGFVGALVNDLAGGEMMDPGASAERTAGKVNDFFTKPVPGMRSFPVFEGGKQVGTSETGPSELGQEYTRQASEALGPASMSMGVHFPELAPPAESVAAAGRAVAAPVKAVGKAVAEAPAKAATAVVRKGLGEPDPKLVEIAQLADQFPNKMDIPPDRLVPASPGKSVAESVGNAPGSGGHAIENKNKVAYTKNTINEIDPTSTADRLDSKSFNAAVKNNGKAIDASFDQAGPMSAREVQDAMSEALQNSVQNGAGDVPRLVQNRFDELLGKADEKTGEISPEALRQWDSDLGRQARSLTDDEAAGHISDLQSAVRDVVESHLSDEQAQVLRDARRRYAYSMMLEPAVAKAGQGTNPVIGLDGLVNPGRLINVLNSTRVGRSFVARDRGGPITDLARVGQLLDNTTPALGRERGISAELASNLLHAGATLTGARTIAGKAYNAVGQRVTEGMVPPAQKNAPTAPPAPPKPLLLGYQPPQAPPVPVTSEGQAVLPSQAQAREDFQTSQRVAGGTGQPPLATTYADYDLNTPEFQPPQTTMPAATAPSELAAVEQKDFQPAPSRGEQELPSPSFPHDITEPDTAKVMVSGPPGETAATEAHGAAMQTPEAELARRTQEAANAPKEPEPPKHPPNEAEQAKLDQIRSAMAATDSPIVQDALNKAEAQVLKDVKTRHTLEEAVAAAKELREHAKSITDPAVKQALLDRAEKLDPTPKETSNEKPAAKPPRIIESRKDAGRGKTGQAAPGKENGGQGGQGNAVPNPAGQQGEAGGNAGQGAGNPGANEDAVIKEVGDARFNVAHPRGPNGRFKPKE